MRAETVPGSGFESVVPSGLEWLDLQWTIQETDHINWRHRFDRLNVRYAPGDLFEFIVGRQTISWATTLFLTPADPFIPFDPSDPFREYRAGVDAFRAQAFPSPLSDLDFVVRPTKRTAADGTEEDELTVAGRGRTVWNEWEVSAWAGALYDEPALAIGAAGGLGALALRSEALLTRDEDDPVLAATVGVDGRIDALGRDLYLVFEYQYDGFGAASASELSEVVQSDAFNRSKIRTVVTAVITSNMRLAKAPGNVTLTQKQSGLPKASVVNVSQIVTLDKRYLTERAGRLTRDRLRAVEAGLRLVLSW